MKVVLRKRPDIKMFDENIKSIFSFTNVMAIYEEFCTKDELDALSEDYKGWLDCANDYNPAEFFVINGNLVIVADRINGLYFSACTLADFFRDNYHYYKEEYANL